MAVTFDLSGEGEIPITLVDIQTLAIEMGYAKPNVDPSKPLTARANMKDFFDMYGVKALTNFKKRFYTEKLAPIPPGGTPMLPPSKKKDEAQEEFKAIKKVEVDPSTIPDVAQYAELTQKVAGLKWRVISRPGGATMKPNDFYRLMACITQVDKGDNTTEKPMWADHGGLDFDGRESWDAWTALKGKSAEDAKKTFCLTWAEAHADSKTNFRA
ncbi:hypothetical protein CYMTET_28651 [Cymbomonas tetramitiformis]|uniref:ACB domain-containing protein n=1 Tax=Cymbomonas tetramitiformis TaxID=36881 RepID=A0AAE0FMU9_9CHLO|nr:hypothetical protein CYMTET_28651 [Cymbomonas tetramitiformis]